LQRDTERLRQRLAAAMEHKLEQAGSRLGHLAGMLESLSPLATLQRGYAIVTDKQGKVVRDTTAVAVGDEVRARLAKGQLTLEVKALD
jgi:exodeoxyribonuclease VII large subunit